MKIFKISSNDNVGVILDGDKKGHKVALCDIKKGENITKYGYPIGIATSDIKKDEIVHTHNLKTGLGAVLDYTYKPDFINVELKNDDTFMGYLREDGRAGIRNEIWIIPTVGCVSKVAEEIAIKSNKYSKKICDGVFAFPHPYGCSQLGADHLSTQKILSALIKHPNTGGVLVLGLGCENNRVTELKKVIGEYNPERIKFLECQSVDDEISEGLKMVESLIENAMDDKRTKLPISKLVVGIKCGGSDGFSGITANPLVGAFSDVFIKNGGTVILTEVPEMFGAETLLMNRCITETVFNKTVKMINNFKEYYHANNQPIYENPSPGNKDGGISTLEEKSLGCTQKSGMSPVVDVLDYGEQVKRNGLNLLSAPGNDLVAATALAASGANIVLFTTGRGTPFGCPVPTYKISTNSNLYHHKSSWIDYDAGVLLENMDKGLLALKLYGCIKSLANGEIEARNEINNYREIAIFKTGVTL
jgi:altronate hydrolase